MRKSNYLLFTLLVFLQPFLYATEPELSLRLRAHLEILASDSLEGRGLGTRGSVIARNYIANQFREAGLSSFSDDYFQPFQFRQNLAWISAVNVVGYIEGSDPDLREEFIVIGAHYDHLGYTKDGDDRITYFGADDNASGVASIIETAHYFAANPHLLKRSLIVVAFDAEESGLHGSRFFVANPPLGLEKIKLMFSYDMVGMYGANEGVGLTGIGSLVNGAQLAEVVAAKHGVVLKNTSDRIARRTDTAPFGNRGIPAAHVFTGTNSPYHKPEDTYDLLDYEGMALVNFFMKDFLSVLSAEKELLPSPSLTPETPDREPEARRRIRTGVLVNTGSGYHRYKDEFFDAKALFSVSTGFYLNIPVFKLFNIQPEILYDYNGSRIAEGNFRRHSVTVPLNFQVGTPGTMSNDVRLYIFGGAWFRYHFDGSVSGETIGFDDQYTQEEWGYSSGIVMEIFRISVGYTNRRGLTSIRSDSYETVYETNNYLSLGFRF